MKTGKAYIATFGCQMNVYDTNRMQNMLLAAGYTSAESFRDADLVVINTCAIREKAVQKVHSLLGRICGFKRRRPHMKIAVTGCVAQQQSRWLAERFSGVDLVLGTQAVNRLPQYLESLKTASPPGVPPDASPDASPVIDVDMSAGVDISDTDFSGEIENSDVSAFVTIMRGCDNFCTYCVVPYVRGRETSRTPERIMDEIRAWVRAGTREVTLLGQNVNSYGQKEGLCTFPELLEQIHDIDGLKRIRFVTSHPKDLSDALVSAYAALPRLANHIHLPVQSGANRILSRMNRRYTREAYLERLEKLREARPDIAVTTDFIAGFPGETEADFEDTMDLIRQAGFDTLFAFEYSDRPEAPASRLAGKVDSAVKKRRLREILDLQAKLTARIYREQVGTTQTVLVSGKSKRPRQEIPGAPAELSGRTPENRIVNFTIPGDALPDPEVPEGRLVDVYIEKACANSLRGTLASRTPDLQPAASMLIKGGKTNAA